MPASPPDSAFRQWGADESTDHESQTRRAGRLASYSRPRVSNDNAFVESLFRVLKYRPQWPSNGFSSLHEARQWVERFVSWYNTEHRHSKLNFVTPLQRLNGKDTALLAQRQAILEQAKQCNPLRRGTRSVRNCEPIGPVTLNPEKEIKMQQAA